MQITRHLFMLGTLFAAMFQTVNAVVQVTATGTTSATAYSLIGAPYGQSFDTLPFISSFNWANNSTLPGWYAISGTGNLDTSVSILDGTSNSPDLKLGSVGLSGSSERSLSYHTRVEATPTYLGLGFINNSGAVLTSFSLAYVAEQWKEGTNNRTVTIAVEYRVGATLLDLSSPTGWTQLPGMTSNTLDGSALQTIPLSTGPIDVAVPDGSTIWIRWVTTNSATSSTASHDLLTIDDVEFSATADVSVAPYIATQPVSITVPEGQPASFTVYAVGSGTLFYEWFFGDTSLGPPSSDPAAAILTIDPVQQGDAGDYHVLVSNTEGSSSSDNATLTVGPPLVAPTITAHPESLSSSVGDPVSFSVTATGSEPLTYQWYFNGEPIIGADQSSLSYTSGETTLAGDYTVTVTNAVDSVVSNPATLTVIVTPASPAILVQPAAVYGTIGGSADFCVTVEGSTPFTYQWQKEGVNIGEAQESSSWSNCLTINELVVEDAGNYRVIVTNSLGQVISDPVFLTIFEGLPAASYNLSGFGYQTTGSGIIPESDPGYYKVTNAAELRAAVTDKTVKVIEIMNNLDLGWNEIPSSEQTGRFTESATPLMHPVLLQTGVTTVYIQDLSDVTIFSANGSTIRHAELSIKRCSNLIIRNLCFDELWEWDESSKGDYDRNDWDFMTIDGACTNVWIDHCDFGLAYDGTVDVKGGSNHITISWCRFLDDSGTPGSWVRQQIDDLEVHRGSRPMYNFLRTAGFSIDDIVDVKRPQKKGHLVGATSLTAENADLSITLHHNLYVGLQDRLPRIRAGNAHVYNVYVDNRQAFAAKQMYDTRLASMSSTDASKLTNGTYQFGIIQNGSISTEGGAVAVERSYYDGVRYALRNNQTDPSRPEYTGKIRGIDMIFKYDEIDFRGSSNDPGHPLGPVQAPIIPFSWNGMTTLPYTYQTDDPADLPPILYQGTGAGVLDWDNSFWFMTSYSDGNPESPVIISQPESQNLPAGSTAIFTVVASGTEPLSYQWRLDDVDLTIPSASTDTLILTDVDAEDNGIYTVVVTGGELSTTSWPATLSLFGKPVITRQPTSQSIVVGTSLHFRAEASSATTPTYQWHHNDTPIPGATNPLLKLLNPGYDQAGIYELVVSNAAGSTATDPVELTVEAPAATTGDDIFVAPDGLVQAPGTFDQPTTLQDALTRVNPGRTIWLRGGTYSSITTIAVPDTNNGLGGARKKLFAYPGEIPVIDFTGQTVTSTSRGIELHGNFWHLRGLIVQNAGDNGIFIGGSHNIIERCLTRFNADTGVQLSRASSSYADIEQWPAYNLVLNCDSHDNRDPGDENADGFAAKLTCGEGNVFRSCIAHHNIDDGWDMFTRSSDGPIGAVTVDQCISYANGSLSDGSTSGTGDKNGFKLGGEGIPVPHVITRCISFDNGKNGFTWNSNAGAILLMNNFAWDNAEGNYKFDLPGATFFNNASLWTSGSGTNDRYGGNSGIPTGPTNVFWCADGSPQSYNDLGIQISAADFKSLSVPVVGFNRHPDGSIDWSDFVMPVSDSPLINAGTLVTGNDAFCLVFDQASVFEGIPDIGAREYVTEFSGKVTYADWAIAWGLSGGSAAPDIDIDLDGFSNLLEYGLGRDPTVADREIGNPELVHKFGQWTYIYKQPDYITDITYSVRISTDFLTWTDAESYLESTTDDETIWVSFLPAGEDGVFIRLEIEMNQ